MPYLRCPNCGLLAHVILTAHAGAPHCPRCRGHEQKIHLSTVDESLRQLPSTPDADSKPVR